MSTLTTPRPTPGRAVALALFAAAIGAVLIRLPVAVAPAAPSGIAPWWESVGTAVATMWLVRSAALVVATWLLLAALFALVAALSRSPAALRLFIATMPSGLRRAVVASSVVVSASMPSLSTAAELADAPPVLRDLGPVHGGADAPAPAPAPAAPVLVDLGPVALAEPLPEVAAADDIDTWTVTRGDHLWSVAEDTLRDRGTTVDDATTAHYWRELIAANPAAIGDDPDLIHPGVVLTLPV